MSRAFVLYAHPCQESYSAALHSRVIDRLKTRGWEVDDCDLHAEGFNPVLSAEERRTYHDTSRNIRPVAEYVERLRAADSMVMVFPVWNYGYPAILKGFFDRVFLPGVSFRMKDGRAEPALQNIHRIAAVTTYGGTRMRSMMAGDPPRRLITRTLRALTWPSRVRYLALYDMNRAQEPVRRDFLDRVGVEMEQF